MTANRRLDNMAQFELTAEQQALRERARELAREAIEPRAAEVDRTEQYPWDNVEALRAAGFMGMTIPPAYGGQGRSFLDAALVIDEMAQACGVTGRIVVEANMGAISALMHYGTEAQKRLGCPAGPGRRQARDLHHRARRGECGERDDDPCRQARRRLRHQRQEALDHGVAASRALHLVFARGVRRGRYRAGGSAGSSRSGTRPRG